MQIISRAQWGAQHEDGFDQAPLPAREVWLHHSVTVAPDLVAPFDDEDQAVRTLERIGEQRFGRGISYTFAVMPTGRVYEGHGIGRQGAHTAKRNSIARAIVLVGNYEEAEPTPAQRESVAQLLAHGAGAGWWAPKLNGGHQNAPGASTLCPGRHAVDVIDWINARAAELVGGAAPAPAPPLPTAPLALPGLPAWSLPGGHYYGHIKGPAASHGGFYEGERRAVQGIQRRFIAAGCVPGVSDWRSGWADGLWEDATTQACRRWFARRRPSQPFTTRIYSDDYGWL